MVMNISSDGTKIKNLTQVVDEALAQATQAIEARKAELADANGPKYGHPFLCFLVVSDHLKGVWNFLDFGTFSSNVKS
jgi:hypothetical protein